jgi:hypothetical protein
VLRLLLLQSTARCIGLQVPEAVVDLDLQAPDVQKQSAVADAVATFAVGPGQDGQPLPKMLGLPSGQAAGQVTFEQRVAYWRGALQAAGTPKPSATLPTARHVIAGAIAAWYDVSQIADANDRLKASKLLREATVAVLRASGPEGTRGDLQAEAPDVGELFANRLRQAGRRINVQ